MTTEYRSKVEDAFKMVLDVTTKTIDSGKEIQDEASAAERIDELVSSLGDAYMSEDMAGQKKRCKQIASTAILYMVKFL